MRSVSVPCSGLIFLLIYITGDIHQDIDSFRPLLGAYFLSKGQNNSFGKYKYRFPSPVRGLFFYDSWWSDKALLRCSVSVPFLGLIFLCMVLLKPNNLWATVRFPSPARGLFFYTVVQPSWHEILVRVSVPFLGLSFLFSRFFVPNVLTGFRPLLGAYFFINAPKNLYL